MVFIWGMLYLSRANCVGIYCNSSFFNFFLFNVQLYTYFFLHSETIPRKKILIQGGYLVHFSPLPPPFPPPLPPPLLSPGIIQPFCRTGTSRQLYSEWVGQYQLTITSCSQNPPLSLWASLVTSSTYCSALFPPNTL